jgi:hypothetical protein
LIAARADLRAGRVIVLVGFGFTVRTAEAEALQLSEVVTVTV